MAVVVVRRTFIHVESELSDSDDDAEGIPMMHCRTDPGFPRYHDATPKFATPKMAVVEEGVETPSPKRGHRGRQHVDSDEASWNIFGACGGLERCVSSSTEVSTAEVSSGPEDDDAQGAAMSFTPPDSDRSGRARGCGRAPEPALPAFAPMAAPPSANKYVRIGAGAPQPSLAAAPGPKMPWVRQTSAPGAAPARTQTAGAPRPTAQGSGKGGGARQGAPDRRTTLMLRNLPREYTRESLCGLLDAVGFARLYDFIYIPHNIETHASLGFCFVNFVTPADAQRASEVFDGFQQWGLPGQRPCVVAWSVQEQQGFSANVARYRNSSVMHPSTPEHCRPMVLNKGCPVSFPAPTRRACKPRVIRRQGATNGHS